jgi:hypothetical protein
MSTERFGRLGVPGGALLGQAARFMLSVPGLQGGLLRQLQRLHRRRRPSMITLKSARQPISVTGWASSLPNELTLIRRTCDREIVGVDPVLMQCSRAVSHRLPRQPRCL